MKTFFIFKTTLVALTFCTISFLAGCATWTAEKCQGTNWDSQGYTDGSVGKNNSGGVYASRCQKKKINIDGQAYDSGYQRGLTSFCNYNKGHQAAFSGAQKEAICSSINPYNQGYAKGTQEYCTSDNGYKVAIDGGEEAKICTGGGQAAFAKGFSRGRKKFVLEEIANLKDDLVKATKDLDDTRDKLSDKQQQLSRIPQRTYEPEVVRLRQETQSDIDNLMRTRDEIKGQVDDMTSKLSQLEKEARTN